MSEDNKISTQNLSTLARIGLSDQDHESLHKGLEGIFGYVDAVSGIQTKEVADSSLSKNVSREDDRDAAVEPSEFTQKLVSQSPERKDDYVLVQKVL